MKTLNFPNKIIISTLILSSSLFCATSEAALTDIGNGLIYDSTMNVTWISNGLTFTNDIATNTSNPTANPYIGPLLDLSVTPPGGSAHTIEANDLTYDSGLGRWVGSWWAATAWADSYTHPYGSQTISDWRLPTTAEAQNLYNQLGAGSGATTPLPFTWVPPFYWTSNVTNGGENADVARPVFGGTALNVANLTLMNGAVPRYSNVWAVVPGNVSAVPIPAAAWLFGGAMAGLIGFSRCKPA